MRVALSMAAMFAAFALAMPAAAQPVDGPVRVVLKIVKRRAGAGVRFDPASCAAGVLTVEADAVRALFRSDRDIGALLSPSAVPAPPPSVFVNDG